MRGLFINDPERVEPFIKEGNARYYARNGLGTELVVSVDGGVTWQAQPNDDAPWRPANAEVRHG